MKMKNDDKIEEVTPEEYTAIKKAQFWDDIASSVSWICVCFMMVCCHYCTQH